MNSTNYYRKNREKRNVSYKCSHCDYVTYNSKKVLENHTNSKHVEEENRPHQCTECPRGFSQLIHLTRHLEREHDIKDRLEDRKIITHLYMIYLGPEVPKSKKTKARREYYMRHRVMKGLDIYNNLHEYQDGCFIKNHDLHYDKKKGFIIFNKIPVMEGSVERDKRLKIVIRKTDVLA
jgi:uncharacterized Zn-finger protein